MKGTILVMCAKQRFLELLDLQVSHEKRIFLRNHVIEVEKWAHYILTKKYGIDHTALIASVWLHDIGHLIQSDEHDDHAVVSALEAERLFCELGASPRMISMVTHAVRAHRCADVKPRTMLAKALAVADSASHLTFAPYLEMARNGKVEEAQDKLKRDFRDIGLLPDIQDELQPLAAGWHHVLSELSKCRRHKSNILSYSDNIV